MKKLASVLILALATTACTAKEPHVTTAFMLYRSCVQGTLQATQLPATRQGIQETLTGIDSMCLEWSLIWYPAFIDPKEESPELTQAEADRFNALRMTTRQELFDYMFSYLPKPIKKK